MSPILGIYASQITGHLNPFTPTGSYDALASYTVPSGGVSSITFAGLPTGGQYTHLQLRINHQQSNGGVSVLVSLNGDTSDSNYARHVIYGEGGSVFAFGQAGVSGSRSLLYINTAGSIPTASVIDFTDYNNTNKTKVFKAITGKWYSSSDTTVALEGHLWNNTSAINSITLTAESGTISQYSKFSLYGLRG